MSINKLSDTQAAYLAGYIDGEGSLMRYSNKITIKITQGVHGIDSLHTVKEWIGAGCVTLHRKEMDKWQAIYKYVLSSTTLSRELLTQILPYLQIKKKLATELLNDPIFYVK